MGGGTCQEGEHGCKGVIDVLGAFEKEAVVEPEPEESTRKGADRDWERRMKSKQCWRCLPPQI